jgi:hypothetical protein
MISDAKMRAHLLSAIHGLRNSNTGWVPILVAFTATTRGEVLPTATSAARASFA